MSKRLRLIALCLAICTVLALPVQAAETVEPRASSFFAAHDTYLYKTGTTEFQIWFDVIANAVIMYEIGVCSIEVERSKDNANWHVTKTYDSDDYAEMLDTNTGSHVGHVTYNCATPGLYYRAYVTFYARNSSGVGELFRYTASIRM